MSASNLNDLERQLLRSYTKILHLRKICYDRYGKDAWNEINADQQYQAKALFLIGEQKDETR